MFRIVLKNKTFVFITLLTLTGALLHFYNLNWGYPFYFHPDERNIASSVSQLQLPSQMNPHFFAYGSLPIYIIFFTGILINYFSSLTSSFLFPHVTFEQAILISRFYSAFFATLLIPILFLLGKKLKNEKTGLLAAFFAMASVGFIQFSHFGTFEMWLTFFSVLLLWICLQKISYKTVLLMGIVFGTLVAIKVSSLVLLPIPPALIILQDIKKRNIKLISKDILFFIIISFSVYFLTNPFVFSDTLSFVKSMRYESSLALGTLPVFYTGEFFNTIPVIFQFQYIYPFLLNPLITILFFFSSFYLIFKAIKTKSFLYYLLLAICYLPFFSQAFLFAKWTRYAVPTLPFLYLIVAIGIADLVIASEAKQSLRRLPRSFQSLAMTIVISVCCLFAFSYFITAFVRPDTRIAARDFARQNIPYNANILSEVYDLGIVPFNSSFPYITLFNFYDLDNNSFDVTPESLKNNLLKSDYIILPSQRILKTRILNKKKFPKGNAFYTDLLNGNLGFKKIYETPCDTFCKIIYLGDPIFRFEQTANVFDRPTLFIFKKDK